MQTAPRFVAPLALGAALVLGSAGAALAGAPTREFAPAPDSFDLPDTCAFPVVIDIVANGEYATTFYDRAGNPIRMAINGRLVGKVTRVDTGASVVINASGPAAFDLVTGDVLVM